MRGITVHYFAVIELSLSGCPHNKLFGWQPHFSSSSSSSRRSDEHKKGNSKILESTARMRPTHGIKKKLFLAEFLSKWSAPEWTYPRHLMPGCLPCSRKPQIQLLQMSCSRESEQKLGHHRNGMWHVYVSLFFVRVTKTECKLSWKDEVLITGLQRVPK